MENADSLDEPEQLNSSPEFPAYHPSTQALGKLELINQRVQSTDRMDLQTYF